VSKISKSKTHSRRYSHTFVLTQISTLTTLSYFLGS